MLEEPPRLEGEIVVSIDTARREAADAGWSADDELLLYVVHGALHLAGYCDKDAGGRGRDARRRSGGPRAARRERLAQRSALERDVDVAAHAAEEAPAP